MTNGSYGKELIIDMAECDANLFNRKELTRFFTEMCELLDMEQCDLHFWDDEGVPEEERQTEPHLKGTSAVQFIMTSNITIHALDLLHNVYLNIFSCKDFDHDEAADFCSMFFKGQVVRKTCIDRL